MNALRAALVITALSVASSCAEAKSPRAIAGHEPVIYSAGVTTLHLDRGDGPVIGVVRGAVKFRLVQRGGEFSEVFHETLEPHFFVKTSELASTIHSNFPAEKRTAKIALEGLLSVPLRLAPHGRKIMSTRSLAIDIEHHDKDSSEVTLAYDVLRDEAGRANATLHGFVDDEDLRAALADERETHAFAVPIDDATREDDEATRAAVVTLASIGLVPVGAAPNALHEGERVFIVGRGAMRLPYVKMPELPPSDPTPHCEEWMLGAQGRALASKEGTKNEVAYEYGFTLEDRAVRLTGPDIFVDGKWVNGFLCISNYRVVDANADHWTLAREVSTRVAGYTPNQTVTWFRSRDACEDALAKRDTKPILVGCAK